MRYALRNQRKIENKLGIDFLNDLKKSLDVCFQSCSDISKMERSEERFNFISVKSLNLKCSYEFYVIKRTYDVYLLAYKDQLSI